MRRRSGLSSPRRVSKSGIRTTTTPLSEEKTKFDKTTIVDPEKTKLSEERSIPKGRISRHRSHVDITADIIPQPTANPSRSKSDNVDVTTHRQHQKLCRDQVQSIRHFIVDDDNDVSDKDSKKQRRKEKVLALKDQMERRAMVNLQFTSIKKVLETLPPNWVTEKVAMTEKFDSMNATKIATTERNFVDEVAVEFDQFAVAPDHQHSEQPNETNVRATKLNREVSFRDLLRNKQTGDTSFRNLARSKMKIDSDDNRGGLVDHFRLISISDESEDPTGADESSSDNTFDFESVLWDVGPLDFTEADSVREDDEDHHFHELHQLSVSVGAFECSQVSISEAGLQFSQFSISEGASSGVLTDWEEIEGDLFSPGQVTVGRERFSKLFSKDFSSNIRPEKAPVDLFKARRRESTGSSDSDKYFGSVNTHNSLKSETESPSKKKKKKGAVETGIIDIQESNEETFTKFQLVEELKSKVNMRGVGRKASLGSNRSGSDDEEIKSPSEKPPRSLCVRRKSSIGSNVSGNNDDVLYGPSHKPTQAHAPRRRSSIEPNGSGSNSEVIDEPSDTTSRTRGGSRKLSIGSNRSRNDIEVVVGSSDKTPGMCGIGRKSSIGSNRSSGSGSSNDTTDASTDPGSRTRVRRYSLEVSNVSGSEASAIEKSSNKEPGTQGIRRKSSIGSDKKSYIRGIGRKSSIGSHRSSGSGSNNDTTDAPTDAGSRVRRYSLEVSNLSGSEASVSEKTSNKEPRTQGIRRKSSIGSDEKPGMRGIGRKFSTGSNRWSGSGSNNDTTDAPTDAGSRVRRYSLEVSNLSGSEASVSEKSSNKEPRTQGIRRKSSIGSEEKPPGICGIRRKTSIGSNRSTGSGSNNDATDAPSVAGYRTRARRYSLEASNLSGSAASAIKKTSNKEPRTQRVRRKSSIGSSKDDETIDETSDKAPEESSICAKLSIDSITREPHVEAIHAARNGPARTRGVTRKNSVEPNGSGNATDASDSQNLVSNSSKPVTRGVNRKSSIGSTNGASVKSVHAIESIGNSLSPRKKKGSSTSENASTPKTPRKSKNIIAKNRVDGRVLATNCIDTASALDLDPHNTPSTTKDKVQMKIVNMSSGGTTSTSTVVKMTVQSKATTKSTKQHGSGPSNDEEFDDLFENSNHLFLDF